jgi:hypothetical protein
MNNIYKLYEQLENFEKVQHLTEQEGFHNCFIHYSNFEEIEDETFHKLKEEYKSISEKLKNYIDHKITLLQDEIDNV